MKILKITALVVLLGFLYLAGDLIANNAAFINTPGPVDRLKVYFTLNRAWTAGGYPLPEVSSRLFFGDEEKLRSNIRVSLRSFSGWKIRKADPGRIEVSVDASFWHSASVLEISLVPVPGGLRMDVVARSLSDSPDLGANRNYILNLYHAIGDENAIHPPV